MSDRQEQRVHQNVVSVDRALAELDLSRATLADVASEAYNARLNATAYDPITAPGYYCWAAAARSLSESLILVEGDWVRTNPLNVPYVQNMKLGVRIGVCNVDRACDPVLEPKRKHHPGPATQDVLATNVTGTLALEGGVVYVNVEELSGDALRTYFLMIGQDGTAELSLVQMNDDDFVFLERIFIVDDSDLSDLDPIDHLGDDDGDDYDVAIERRQ